MWIILMTLCLAASFGVDAQERSLHGESSLERSDSTSRLRNVENVPGRLARRFRGNSRTRRLHIENQHNFDGKVEKIHINSEEDLAGVQAYGIQKKNHVNNGNIERTVPKDVTEEIEDVSRLARSIEAYGKSKDQLEMNGHIETGNPSISPSRYQPSRNPRPRATRSIKTELKEDDASKDLEDLEAQDAKIFRPLFVYRKEMARKQHRARNQIYGYPIGQKPWHNRLLVF